MRRRAVLSAVRCALAGSYRHTLTASTATGVGALVLAAMVPVLFAAPAVADPGPIADRAVSGTVTADALPTTQVDGIVWSQAVVGDTVYAGGKFANARPAGAAAGTNQTARTNLLAYSISTGDLNTAFNPSLNAQVLAVAASPDGTRVYVAGDFTTVNGVKRNRIAAFDTATGNLVTSFAPNLDAKAKALVATNSTVYVGGIFSTANGTPRNRVAAFDAATGALLSWDPNADYNVNALTLTPKGDKVIAGGAFKNMNGQAAYGLAALDPSSGALLPWNAGSVVQNAGTDAAILSLGNDGTSVYGTGYVYGAGGNLEGAFTADPDTGNIKWVEDCHGDTYSAYSTGSVVYTVSHAHYCGNVGGYPQTDPWTFHHALAFTADATGTLNHDPLGYHDFYGTPSPSLINWFPDLTTGKISGQGQAAWSVTGNGQYVAMGGEFPTVNGTAQAGLVRFAVAGKSTNKQGPRLSGSNFVPSLISLSAGTVRVSFPANWDRDDKTLTYKVTRDGNTAAPVFTTTVDSTFWNRPAIGFTDTGLTPGQTYKYRLYAYDPSGNQVVGDYVNVTVSTGSGISSYGKKVIADGASAYYPLNETSGSTLFDNVAFDDLDGGTGISRGAAGAISGDAASTFDGTTNGTASTRSAITGPNTFTLSTWIRTTSTSGGKIIGFGSSQTGNSTSYDRHIYLDNAGRVWFGVYNNGVSTLNSTAAVNDGQWHQIVASLGSDGMALYVDGRRVAQRADVTNGQAFTGFWRVGGDNLNGWSSQPASNNLAGDIDEVAVFPTALSRQTVQDEWVASGRASTVPTAPADNYGAAVFTDDPNLYWRLGEPSGTTATDSSVNGTNGTYQGGYTQGAAGAIKGTANTAATFDGDSGQVVSTVAVSNPRVYTEEAWFKTTTTRGGKIIGFGDGTSGRSGNYDRHVYMQDNGQIVFGVWTGQTNTITSPSALNDGKWHHVVASQNTTDGMKLYVDGQLVGTNGQTNAQSYTGYWRIGGDNTWGSSSANFAGTIDDVAVYSTVLSQAQVTNHWNLGSSTVAQNNPPTAAFTTSAADLTASFDGSGSTDDGTIGSYAWDFGDGQSGTGRSVQHKYATGGTYTVTLTVTDDKQAAGSVQHQVTVTAPNAAPTAAYTSSTADLTASFDATGSVDTDGSIASYAWDFGDSQAGTGVKPSHAYGSAGTYTVTLTVTDDKGATNQVQHTVTVTSPPPVNKVPTAAFTATPTNLSVAFDASGSTDADGAITSYAWTFGDGKAGTGRTVNYTYAAAGTYQVSLTVTDNAGATNTVTKTVTATAPASTVIAKDTFTRAVTSGFGAAETGGAWTTSGSNSTFAVSNGAGRMTASKAGAAPLAVLANAKGQNVDYTADFSLDKAPTGGGSYVALVTRRVGTSDYRLQVVVKPTATTLSVVRVVNNTETAVKTVTITGLTYTAGATWHLRFAVSGSGTTTLTGKVWKDGTTEPTAWQVSATDTTAALQVSGAVGVRSYLSSSSTSVPVVTSFDNVGVTLLP